MICEICGKEFEKSHYGKSFKNICSSECFYKRYWLDVIKDKDKYTIVNGWCYCFDKENPIKSDYTQWNGCAGRVFKVRFFNGETYTTNNMWVQGEIPEEFRDRLQDNAEFVRE